MEVLQEAARGHPRTAPHLLPPSRKGEESARRGPRRSIRSRGGLGGLLAALVLAAALAPAAAQTRAPARPVPQAAPAKPPEPVPEPPPPPYERDLLRLSEIIGALAFLRELCTEPDAAEWPSRMRALLDAEGTTPARRERLAGAYNRGYRGYAVTYRTCTASAIEAATRFLAEGDRLARSLASRYGG